MVQKNGEDELVIGAPVQSKSSSPLFCTVVYLEIYTWLHLSGAPIQSISSSPLFRTVVYLEIHSRHSLITPHT